MNYGVVEQGRSSSADARWLKTNPSLGEIAEHLNRALADKRALERRINELVEENQKLSAQVADGLKKLQENGTGGRYQATFAARERLLKDECERRLQSLQLELNKERYQHTKRLRQTEQVLKKMEQDMAHCICRHVKIEQVQHVVEHSYHVEQDYNLEHDDVLIAASLPPGWKIRNSR